MSMTNAQHRELIISVQALWRQRITFSVVTCHRLRIAVREFHSVKNQILASGETFFAKGACSAISKANGYSGTSAPHSINVVPIVFVTSSEPSLTQHNNNCTLERQSIKSSLNLFTVNWKLLKLMTNSPGAKDFYFGVEITLLAAKLPPENHFICLRKRHKMASHWWSTAQKRLQSAKLGVTWLSRSPSTNRECAELLCMVIFSHREIAYQQRQ